MNNFRENRSESHRISRPHSADLRLSSVIVSDVRDVKTAFEVLCRLWLSYRAHSHVPASCTVSEMWLHTQTHTQTHRANARHGELLWSRLRLLDGSFYGFCVSCLNASMMHWQDDEFVGVSSAAPCFISSNVE